MDESPTGNEKVRFRTEYAGVHASPCYPAVAGDDFPAIAGGQTGLPTTTRTRTRPPILMKLTGIADEAGPAIDTQIKAVKELGWNAIEMRNVATATQPSGSVHEIPENAFDEVRETLAAAGVAVPAIGSTIANWAREIEEPYEITDAQIQRLIPRAKALGTTHVRIMSYAVRKQADGSDHADQLVNERVKRLRDITGRLLDAGLVPVHENCMNYGGMSLSKTLELLEKVPGLKLVFDTANPVFNRDRDAEDGRMQDPWAFYQAVRDHVVHVHIKDCVWNPAKNDADYTWPGEGDGRVRDILADLKARHYDGWISIEPHMAVVFHDTSGEAKPDPEGQYRNFVDYGRKLAALIDSL